MQSSENLIAINLNERMKLIKSRMHLPESAVSDVIPRTPVSADKPKQSDMLYEQPHVTAKQSVHDSEPIEVKEGVIGGTTCLVVNSRELWEKMGVGADFSTWIKDKLTHYEFVERVDFEVFARFNSDSGLSRVDFGDSSKGRGFPNVYLLSLSAAIDIAHTERRPLAKHVRQHFKNCEQRLSNAMLSSAVESARAADVRMEQPSAAQIKVEAPKDFVEIADAKAMGRITQALKDRAWQLAMRQYGDVLLLSRDEKACQALAHAIQARLFKQIERYTEKMDEDISTEAGYSKAVSLIEKWLPSED